MFIKSSWSPWRNLLVAAILSSSGIGCSVASQSATSYDARQQPSASGLGSLQAAQGRLDEALRRLRTVYDGPTSIQVLRIARPAAYSCSDGNIDVSLGLIALATDDELCAVIAHEMGHLSGNRAPPTGLPYALNGASHADQEQQADALGVAFLRRAGISVRSLPQLLRKVRDAAQTPAELRPGISVRIALLANP